MPPQFQNVWRDYAADWDEMKLNESRVNEFRSVCKRLAANRSRYEAVAKVTGVPWYMIAAIHERESSQDWMASLAQGDPWNRRSTHVPRGRGPFNSWEEAAVDALLYDGLVGKKDWTIEAVLFYLEQYNGWGYSAHGVPSAYLWAGTSIYRGGKYVGDGEWSARTWDTQLGAAGIIKGLATLVDTNLKFVRQGVAQPAPVPTSVPAPPTSAPRGSWLVHLFKAIFGVK